MSVTTLAAGDPTVPQGYTPEDIEQCKALTEKFAASLADMKGHVALSVVLTTFHHLVEGYSSDARFMAGQHMITVGANIANAAIDAGAVNRATELTATAIAQQVSNLVATKRHGPTIDALLMVLTQLGKKFPCCAGIASAGAAQLAIELGRIAETAQRAGGPETLH